MSWLDRLPAAVRHFLLLVIVAPLAGLVGALALAVVSAGGLDLDWSATFDIAVDAAAVTAANGLIGWIALFVTPLTRQYGVGSTTPPPGDHEAGD